VIPAGSVHPEQLTEMAPPGISIAPPDCTSIAFADDELILKTQLSASIVVPLSWTWSPAPEVANETMQFFDGEIMPPHARARMTALLRPRIAENGVDIVF
jgi:hypothetical protein